MHTRCLPLIAVLSLTGCATVLSGTHQEVSIDLAPEGANAAIVSGVPAEVLLELKEVNGVTTAVLNILGTVVPPEVRGVLASLTPEELLTQAVLAVKLDDVSADEARQFGALLNGIPEPVKEKLAAFLGLTAVGATPWKVNLHKGQPYAVVVWKKGYRPRVFELQTSFNKWVLLNVFTVGIGAVVDVMSGAWLNIDSAEVHGSLEPLRPAVVSTLPPR